MGCEIRSVKARQILDSRGNPTVEVDVYTDDQMARAGVPSGASTGVHEAWELRDKGKDWHGAGVQQAVNNVNTLIAPHLIGQDCTNQENIDRIMREIDGTENKGKLGANAILGVSIAVSKLAASVTNQHWFQYLRTVYKEYHYPDCADHYALPVPFMNVINGGKHAGNQLPFQEFMIAPTGARNFTHAVQMGSEVYHHLKKLIKQKHGIDAVNVGDEGGFAPPVTTIDQPLDLLMEAIHNAGYDGQIKLAMDAAASEMFTQSKQYDLEFKKPADKTHKIVDVDHMHGMYQHLVDKYPIISIEDPFDQEDFTAHGQLLAKVKQTTQIVGDDLLVTNVDRVSTAIEQTAANSLLLKINQIGSITEAMQAAAAAQRAGWTVMVSHRSGETEDPYIADLAVALNAGQIKTGAPCRSERTAKYNQLLRIDEFLDSIQATKRYGWQ